MKKIPATYQNKAAFAFDLDGTLADPGEAITAAQALHAYTRGSAYASRQEHVKGSIAPGMLADLVVLSEDPTAVSPERIAGLAVEEGKGLIILVNKIDLVKSESFDREQATEILRKEFAFAPFAIIIYGSALTRKGIHKIWNVVSAVSAERRKRVPTAKLNQVVRDAFRMRPPAPFRGHVLKCFYVTQGDVAPPTFVFFVNDPRLLHFSYRRYLENNVREEFGFMGTPLRFVFRPRVRQDATEAKDVIAAAVDENDAP